MSLESQVLELVQAVDGLTATVVDTNNRFKTAVDSAQSQATLAVAAGQNASTSAAEAVVSAAEAADSAAAAAAAAAGVTESAAQAAAADANAQASATSAAAASTNATAAALSAAAAADSATAAQTAVDSIGTAVSDAQSAATAASGSASAAAASAGSVGTAATDAQSAATAAAGSATAAATSAGNASTSAGSASTYAQNAEASATAADTSATNAATSATNAANSAAAAATSATQAQVAVPAGGSTGQILAKKTNADRDTQWIDAPSGGSSGEANTASNLGTGVGVFAQKATFDLQFKSFKAGANITLTPSATEITIDVSGLAAVAKTGSYADLTSKPALFSGAYADLTGAPALATVATTGAYADLSGKPTIPSAITVKDEGVTLTAAPTAIDFVGAGVAATNTGGAVTVTISGSSGSALTVKDEGTNLSTAVTSIDFTGAGVTASNTGGAVTVNVPSSGGGTAVSARAESRVLLSDDFQYQANLNCSAGFNPYSKLRVYVEGAGLSVVGAGQVNSTFLPDAVGVLTMTLPTTSGVLMNANFGLASNGPTLGSALAVGYELSTRISVGILNAANNPYDVCFGCIDNGYRVGLTTANYVGFIYGDSAANANWVIRKHVGTVKTDIVTDVPVTTGAFNLKIKVISQTQVECYINGVLKGTVTHGLPSIPVEPSINYSRANPSTNGTQSLYVDWLEIYKAATR